MSWKPNDQELCLIKTSSIERCQNFVRLISLVAHDRILLCGTNAGQPECRKYTVRIDSDVDVEIDRLERKKKNLIEQTKIY